MNETIRYLFERKQEGDKLYFKYSIQSAPFERRNVDFNLLWSDITAFVMHKSPVEDINQDDINYINRNGNDKIGLANEWITIYYNRDSALIHLVYEYGYFKLILNNLDEFCNFITNKKAEEWAGSAKRSVQAVCSSVILADIVKEPVEYSINFDVPQFEVIGNKIYKIKREETEYSTVDDMIADACKVVADSMNRRIITINATHKLEIDNLLLENDNRLHESFLDGLKFESYAKGWIISKDFITLKKKIVVDKVFYNEKFYDFSQVKKKLYVKDIIVSLHSPNVRQAYTSKAFHPNASTKSEPRNALGINAHSICVGKELESKPINYVIPRLVDTLRIANIDSPLSSEVSRWCKRMINEYNLVGMSEWNGWSES